MRLMVVFDADPDLGPDPLDDAKQPRKLWEFIDHHNDCLLIWREWGEQFEGGYRDHVVSQGIWENITDQQRDQIIGWLEPSAMDLPEASA